MKKKFSFAFCYFLLFFSFKSYAELLPLNNGSFTDEGVVIKYPCSIGGHPLVIYGSPIDSETPVSSSKQIFPLYVQDGFSADPLIVTVGAQTVKTSTDFLIVKSANPGGDGYAIQFGGLERTDGKEFFVNSVNFSSVDAKDSDQFVSIIEATGSGAVLARTSFPFSMHSFDNDTGLPIEKNVKNISGTQSAWNQKTPWRDYSHPNSYSVVKYRFIPAQSPDNPDFYNGRGFWICGNVDAKQTTAVSVKTQNSNSVVPFKDIIKNTDK